VGVLIPFNGRAGTCDQVKMTLGADGKPCMSAVMKRLRDGVQSNRYRIEIGALRKIVHVEGNMIDPYFLSPGEGKRKEKDAEKDTSNHMHVFTGRFLLFFF
jgi:hypothetical protein